MLAEVREVYEDALKEVQAMPRPKGQPYDPVRLQEAARRGLDRLKNRLGNLRYQQYARLLGRGMEDAGLRAGELRIAPQTIENLAARSPLWGSYTDMTGALTTRVNDIIGRALMTPGGWSAPEMKAALADAWGAEQYRIDRIVRTETHAVINQGREMGYREVEKPDWRYVWDGPRDFRTTDACDWLAKETKKRGGVTLDEMDALIEQARARWFSKLEPRPGVVHINERHSMRKLVGQRLTKAEFEESEHPRDQTGEFTDKPGVGPRAPPHKKPGERVSGLGGRKVLEAVGMREMKHDFPRMTDTQTAEGWSKTAPRFEGIRGKLGSAYHPTRFPVDGIDDENRTVWEVKTYSKASKDVKIKSGHSIDRKRKEMVARHLGYRLKTRLILANGATEMYEMDGFKGVRPSAMRRVR